jgi:hypothetical protein
MTYKLVGTVVIHDRRVSALSIDDVTNQGKIWFDTDVKEFTVCLDGSEYFTTSMVDAVGTCKAMLHTKLAGGYLAPIGTVFLPHGKWRCPKANE